MKSMRLPLDYEYSRTEMSKEGSPSEVSRLLPIFFPKNTWEFWAHDNETYQERISTVKKKPTILF